MKSVLLFFTFFSVFAHGNAIEGEQYLQQWTGSYTVTECIECPDHRIDGGANLKNFKWFGIGVFQIPNEDLLRCAQTNISIGFSYGIQRDDALPNDGTSISSSTGQCDWGYEESLKATATNFVYKTRGMLGKKVTLSIQKKSLGIFELEREESDSTPSWGLPVTWKYKALVSKP